MLDKIANYDNSLPKFQKTLDVYRWSLLFLYDQAFGITDKSKDEIFGATLRKVDGDTRIGRRFSAAHSRNVKSLVESSSKSTFSQPIDLPSISAEEFNNKGFKHWKNKIGKPIVVRGYLKDAPILDLMSPDQLVDNYGDKEVKCVKIIRDNGKKKLSTVGQNLEAVTTTLKEFLTSDQFNDYYINNYYGVIDEDVFQTACKGHQINQLMEKENVLAQWFISRPGKGAGSTLHCAGADNIFLNIAGRKEWHFIDPAYTSVMQPALSRYGSFCASELEDEIGEDFFADFTAKYDYMRHVPIYRVVLEEGDMLYNPSWWWHRVKNLSSLNIGCATRYVEDRIAFVNSTTLWMGLAIETIKNPKKSLVFRAKKSLSNKKDAPKLIDSIFSKNEKSS